MDGLFDHEVEASFKAAGDGDDLGRDDKGASAGCNTCSQASFQWTKEEETEQA
jgi:hypothetical protein